MNWYLHFIGTFSPLRHIVDYSAMSKEKLTQCPTCGLNLLEDSTYCSCLDRYGFPVFTNWCKRCDSFFLNPRPSSKAYSEFYNSGGYRKLISAFSNGKDDHHLPQKRVKRLVSLLRSVAPDRALRVLNIGGTRTDYDLLVGRIKIDRYVCLNPGETEAGEGYKVIHQTIEDFDPKGQKFDVICMFGTLNHLTNTVDVFKKIAGLMKPQSIFIFDFKDPIIKMLSMTQPIGAIQFDHATYPTRKTLSIMMKSAKLSLYKLDTQDGKVYTILAKLNSVSYNKDLEVNESKLISQLKLRANTFPIRLFLKALGSVLRGRL